VIERTTDLRRVKKLMDENPRADGVRVDLRIGRDVIYLIEKEYGKDLGVWCFEPNGSEYDIHAHMGVMCRGIVGKRSALDAIQWLYENTECSDIVATIPIALKHSQRLTVATGFDFVKQVLGFRYYKMTRHKFNNMKEAA